MARTAVTIATSLPEARVEHLRVIQARERKSLSAVVAFCDSPCNGVDCRVVYAV